MTVAELAKEAAFSAGQHAGAAGLPLSTCPYNPETDPVLALWYVRGYQARGDDQAAATTFDADAWLLPEMLLELGEFELGGVDLEDFNSKHPRGRGGRFGHSNKLFELLKAKAAGAGTRHGDARIDFDGAGDDSIPDAADYTRNFDWSVRERDALVRGGQTHDFDIEGPSLVEEDEDDEGNVTQEWESGNIRLRSMSDGDMRDLTNMIGTALLRRQLETNPFEGNDPRTPYLVAMMDLGDHNTWSPQETTYDQRVSIVPSGDGWHLYATDDDDDHVEFDMTNAEMEALYGQLASYLLTPAGRENESQTASLSGAALKRFNDLHERGFGGKFGDKDGPDAATTAAKVKSAVKGDSGGVEEVKSKARAGARKAAGATPETPTHRRRPGTIAKAIESGQPDALADFKRPALLRAVKDRGLIIMSSRATDQDLRDLLLDNAGVPAAPAPKTVKAALAAKDEEGLRKFGKRALVAEIRKRGLGVGDANSYDVEELRDILLDSEPDAKTPAQLAKDVKDLPKTREGEDALEAIVKNMKVKDLKELRGELGSSVPQSGKTKKEIQHDIVWGLIGFPRSMEAIRKMDLSPIGPEADLRRKAKAEGIDLEAGTGKKPLTSKLNAHSLTAGDEVWVEGGPHRVVGHRQNIVGGKPVVEITLVDREGYRKRRTYGMNEPLEKILGGKGGSGTFSLEPDQTAAAVSAGGQFSVQDWEAASMTEFDLTRMPPHLVKYWLGEGAATHGIAWCTRGSFRRARKALIGEGVPRHMVDGATANLYRMACGKSPGRHGGEHSMAPEALAAADTQVACGCGDMHDPAKMPSAINTLEPAVADDLYADEIGQLETDPEPDYMVDVIEPATVEADDAPSTSRGWRGPLAPINVATGDRRRIAAGALATRQLPLPFRWQERQEKGHDGSVVVGALTGYSIAPDGTIMGEGYWLDPDIIPQVRAAMHLVEHKVIGPSIDLEPNMDVSYIDPETGETFEPHECQASGTCPAKAEALITSATITGATLVPITAFAEVRAPELFDRTAGDDRQVMARAYVASQVAAVRRAGWDDMPIAGRDREFDKDAADANITAWARIGAEPDSPEFWERYAKAFLWHDDVNQDDLTKGNFRFPVADVIDGELTIVPHAVFNAAARVDSSTIPSSGKLAIRDVIEDLYGQMADEFDDDTMHAPWERDHEMSSGAAADCGCAGKWANTAAGATQTAAADFDVFAGMDPYPADAFTVELDQLTPITIEQRPGENFARVFGHAASWKSCNRGFKGVCVPPPKNNSGYAQFHLGAVRTDTGLLPVGKIVQGEGHPDTGTGARIARAFYDRTSKTVAFVRAQDDGFGVKLAGVTSPNITAEEATMLLASPPSGDWKAGEMIAVLSVNVPGHVVPRATWQDGQPVNMVAAGSFWLEDQDALAEFQLLQVGFAALDEQLWEQEAATLAASLKVD